LICSRKIIESPLDMDNVKNSDAQVRVLHRDKQLFNPFEILVEVSNTTEASEPYWVYNFQGNKGNKETKLVANTYSFDDFYQVWQIYFSDKNPFPRFFADFSFSLVVSRIQIPNHAFTFMVINQN